MNIIEAGKALKAGKVVRDPCGFKIQASTEYPDEMVFDDGSDYDYLLLINDMLSEDWEIVDENLG
jgi:hypothetical protein